MVKNWPAALEKTITLVVIDDAWKEHLRAMDDLKQSVQTAYLEQKDPLVIYKVEAFQQFKNMDAEVNKDIVSFLSHRRYHAGRSDGPVIIRTESPVAKATNIA